MGTRRETLFRKKPLRSRNTTEYGSSPDHDIFSNSSKNSPTDSSVVAHEVTNLTAEFASSIFDQT